MNTCIYAHVTMSSRNMQVMINNLLHYLAVHDQLNQFRLLATI